jgi:hypothetical protein
MLQRRNQIIKGNTGRIIASKLATPDQFFAAPLKMNTPPPPTTTAA